MSEVSVRIARLAPSTRVEGPGLRAAIWVAGCSIQCDGCFNPHLFDASVGEDRLAAEIVPVILSVQPAVEGITLLGGEPFDQAQALSVVAAEAQEAALNVMTFTGFTHEHLLRRARKDAGVGDLLASTDLLVDGPFIAAQVDSSRPLLGSRNQRFLPLSREGEQMVHRLEPDGLEVTVAADGRVSVNGWATTSVLEGVLDLLQGSQRRDGSAYR